jgi:hypothetical protein
VERAELSKGSIPIAVVVVLRFASYACLYGLVIELVSGVVPLLDAGVAV